MKRNDSGTVENAGHACQGFFQTQVIQNIAFHPFNLSEQGIGIVRVIRKYFLHPGGIALLPAQSFYTMP
jgi:hypothetical protein